MSTFTDLFDRALRLNGIFEPYRAYGDVFERFCDYLLAENEKYNLTAIRTVEGVVVKHFVDSLLIEPLVPANATVVDLGCGAGFPSIPLAIVRSDIRVFPVDSTGKKIDFVQNAVKTLDLPHVSPIVGRIEDVSVRKRLGYVDCVVSRAVAALPVLSELSIPLLKTNGLLIAMKSKLAEEELKKAKSGISLLGGTLKEIKSAEIKGFDGEAEERNQIVIQKIKQTPAGYPRQYNQILKKPL